MYRLQFMVGEGYSRQDNGVGHSQGWEWLSWQTWVIFIGDLQGDCCKYQAMRFCVFVFFGGNGYDRQFRFLVCNFTTVTDNGSWEARD